MGLRPGAGVTHPSRGLDELGPGPITALAAAPDGLWVATTAGLFHVDQSLLS